MMVPRDSGVGRGRLRAFGCAVWSPTSGSCKAMCFVAKKEGSREELEDLEWKAESKSKARTEEAAERVLELDLRSTGGKVAFLQHG